MPAAGQELSAMTWGLLPRVTLEPSATLKRKILIAYANTYLKEEVWGEHLVKNLDPFRRFLEIAAQGNGKLIYTLDLDYKLSYFTTAHGLEIDLVVERPGKTTLLVEIKSAAQPHQINLKNLSAMANEIPNSEAVCFSNCTTSFQHNEIPVYPWKTGIEKYILEESPMR